MPQPVRATASIAPLIGTRKGAFILRGDRARRAWKLSEPIFLGYIAHHFVIGFPMVVHPRDADTVWVFPMDGTTVWPRTSPEGKPAV